MSSGKDDCRHGNKSTSILKSIEAFEQVVTCPNSGIHLRQFSETNTQVLASLQKFMDSPLDHYGRKYIKKMMLKQEQAFKSQVHELHRLYKVQKTLMDVFGAETNHSSNLRRKYNQSSSTRTREPCLSSLEDSETQIDSNAQQSAIEFDEHDVELTLSIGCHASKRKSKNWLHNGNEFGCFKSTAIEELGEQCHEPSSHSNRESEADPPWLCQALSLKRT